MKRWNVCPASRRPKGILTNSNNPNGVMTAGFGDICFMDRDLMISTAKIYLWTNLLAMQRCGKVVQVRHRVPVGYSLRIKGSVILAGSPVSIWFGDHVQC